MEKKQLRGLIIILILPLIFAGVGYFGMKVFLSGSGPKTVMPEQTQLDDNSKNETSLINDTESNNNQLENNGEVKPETKIEIETETETEVKTDVKTDNKTETNPEVVSESNTQKKDQASSTNTSQPDNMTESFKFESINFYSLQVGSYSSLSNANKHVESLKEEGLLAYVFTGTNYKVMIGASASREGVDALKTSIVDSVPDAFVKGMMIAPDTLKYSKENTDEIKTLKSLNDQYLDRVRSNLKNMSELYNANDIVEASTLESDLGKVRDLLSTLKSIQNSKVLDQPVQQYNKQLTQIESKLRQHINNATNRAALFETYIQEILHYNQIN